MILLQTEEAIDKALEVASIGKDASVTTIGVMAVLCIILLAFTIGIWRAKSKRDKEYNSQQLKFLEAITTANVILKDVQLESKNANTTLNEVKSVLSEMKGYITGLKNKDS